MGWFTNSDDDSQNNNTEEFTKSFSQMSGTSVSRTCRPDPEDNKYLVCKTVTQRHTYKNGKPENTTEEKEERIPVNQPSNNSLQPFARDPNLGDLFNGSNDFQSLERSLEDHFKNFFGRGFGLFDTFFPEFRGGPAQEEQDRFEPIMPPFFRPFFDQGMNGKGFNSEWQSQQPQEIPRRPNQNSEYGRTSSKPYDYNFAKKKKRSEDDIFDL